MAVVLDRVVKVDLPVDRQSQSIQILSPVQSTAVNDTSLVGSRRLALPTTSEIITITNTQDIWVKFGDVTVAITTGGEADTFLLLAGSVPYQVPTGSTHIAYMRRTTDGVICIYNLN